ncbi:MULTISPECIES: ABC transporter ATP-binding protein [unclassified Rhizobium]|uniref:ABC transporter ATP-binding protein n=2 Tax=Rhizobium TaxID=379 RepID=UPI0037F507B4
MMKGVKVASLGVSLRQGIKIVDEVSFEIEPGEVLGLVGESGSGKSTIAKALLGYAGPGAKIASGSVIVDGEDILALSETERRERRGRVVSYVPQDAGMSLNPGLAIGTQLIERLIHGRHAESRAEALGRIASVLDAVRLPADRNFLARYPSELSGGQLQRIGLAIAVVSRPRLLVLDEPTTALDVGTRHEVLKLVSELSKEMNLCSVYVSHDLGVISAVADQVMVLYAGRIMEYGSSNKVLGAPAHPYSRALLKAVPTTLERKQLQGIPGTAPDLKSRESGCVFAARCPIGDDLCATVEPGLVMDGASSIRCYKPNAPENGAHVIALPLTRPHGERICSVQNLVARYGPLEVVRNVSLEIAKGECVALVGESGSGKSTFARCLIGLHSNYDGAVKFYDRTLPQKAEGRDKDCHRRIQYIFQDPYASLNPRRTVGDSIGCAVRHFFPGSKQDIIRAVLTAAVRAGLSPDLMSRYPSELSGGERQRVAIARALVCRPDLLVCDEPTSALDVSVQASIIELLRGLMTDGLAMLFVTHDLAVVRSIADRVVVLQQGEMVESATTETMFSSPKTPYSRDLLSHALNVQPAVAS